MLLLLHRAYLESFCNLLATQVTVANTCILFFLLLDSAKFSIAFALDLKGDAEFSFSDLLHHVELGVEAVALSHRVGHYYLRGRVKKQPVWARTYLNLGQFELLFLERLHS